MPVSLRRLPCRRPSARQAHSERRQVRCVFAYKKLVPAQARSGRVNSLWRHPKKQARHRRFGDGQGWSGAVRVMLGLYQGSDSEDMHETSASSPPISTPASHATSDHGHKQVKARHGHADGAVVQHSGINGRPSAPTFPVHLLSACSSSSRNMCPFANSITSREILSGVGGVRDPGTSAAMALNAGSPVVEKHPTVSKRDTTCLP
jgi:hypothetical protein